MSHHLTLAYSLLPAIGLAFLLKRWGVGLGLGVGLVVAGSEGAWAGLLATGLLALGWRAGSLAAGIGLTLGGIWLWPGLLGERAVLWTGGILAAQEGPAGTGYVLERQVDRWYELNSGLWFPYHAHDTWIQVLGVMGPVGLGAVVWLVGSLFLSRSGACVVGVMVGGLSQDVLGDLEVMRSVGLWAMMGYLVLVQESVDVVGDGGAGADARVAP